MKKIRKILQIVTSLIAWYIIILALKEYTIIIWKWFKYEIDTPQIKKIGIMILIIIMSVLINTTWITYNKKKFGSLNRRKFKEPVSKEELSNYFEIDEKEIEKFQSEKYLELEDTIIDYKKLDYKKMKDKY